MRKFMTALIVAALAFTGYSVLRSKYPDLVSQAQSKLSSGSGTNQGALNLGSSSGGDKASTNQAKTPARTCPDQKPLTKAMLPTFKAGEVTTITNPCLSFSDGYLKTAHLLGGFSDEGTKKFLDQVDKYAKGAERLNTALECAYETDRLAVDIYQHKKWQWSVGFVAVVRGDAIDVALDNAKCQIRRALGFPGEGLLPTSEGPQPDFCFDTAHHGDFTTVWIGSSDLMCQELTAQLRR